MRKQKKPPGTSLSLGSTAKVTKNMLPARATAKSWLKKSQIAHEFCLVQRPYILDVVERAYENKKRGGFVHLKRRGMGVFFSRFALILAYCARSRALSNCQKKKKKEEKKRKQQTTNNKNKEKEKRLWTSYMNNCNFSNFFIFFLLDGKGALFRLRSYRKGQKGHL